MKNIDEIDKEVRRRQKDGEQVVFFHKDEFLDPADFESKLLGIGAKPTCTVLKLRYRQVWAWAGEPEECLRQLRKD